MSRLSELGEAAIVYSRGWSWPVLPLIAGDKRPRGRGGFRAATTDLDSVLDTWSSVPMANVGIATGSVSGLVVIDVDVDPERSIDGRETMKALQERLGPLTDRLVVRTPRGGFHLYFAHRGASIPSSAGHLGHGVDVRADGGYIVAPPSRTDVGRWSWVLPDGRLEPRPADLPQLPAAWAAAMRKPERVASRQDARSAEYVRAAIRDELQAVRTAAEGTRNSTLNRSAFALARFAASGQVREADLETLLVQAATESGLDETEARRTVRSALGSRRDAA
jgi:hypothetical protein